MKSRLLLYLLLLPGLAIPWAAMIWFPDFYGTGYRVVVDNPYWVLAVAVTLFLFIGFDALRDTPTQYRHKLIVILLLIACGFIAYVSLSFDSLTIAEATICSAVAIYVALAIVKKQNGKVQDT